MKLSLDGALAVFPNMCVFFLQTHLSDLFINKVDFFPLHLVTHVKSLKVQYFFTFLAIQLFAFSWEGLCHFALKVLVTLLDKARLEVYSFFIFVSKMLFLNKIFITDE